MAPSDNGRRRYQVALSLLLIALKTTVLGQMEENPCLTECLCDFNHQHIDCRGAGFNSVPQNFLSDTVSLDLSENPLSELKMFPQLEHLNALSITNYALSTLHGNSLSKLASLEYLNLDNNLLQKIPKDLGSPMLKVLILSHNALLEFEKLTGPILISETLQELDLSCCFLLNLPEGAFSSLPSLKYLNLHDNKLKTLPPKIFNKLTSLSHLDLSDNFLILPPDTFQHNPMLKTLNMSKLYSDFYTLKELYISSPHITDENDDNQDNPILISPSIETLDLYGYTSIKLHKPSLTSLPSLRHLRIDGIVSPTTSKAFQSLKNLETLHITLRGFENVNGDIFKNNSKLRYLNISLHSKIATPLSSVSITHLDITYFYDPQLYSKSYREFTNDTFENLTELEVVKIRISKPLVLSQSLFWRNPKLRVLDLSECVLHQVPPNIFAKNPHIKEIILHDNYLTYLRTDEDFPGLISEPNNAEHLDLSDNLFTQIPRNFFSSLISLVSLNLSKNPLFGWEEGAFSELSHLEVLDLSQTHLLHLYPDSFVKNSELNRDLHYHASINVKKIINNNIDYTSNSSFHLLHIKTLKVLDLSSAKIFFLPNNTFSGTPSLEKLDLSNNMLRVLDPNILKDHLRNLTYLDMSHNPWRCDCKMAKVRDLWVARNMDPLNHFVVCDMPKQLYGHTWDAINGCGNLVQLQKNSNPKNASIKEKTSWKTDPKNKYPSQNDGEKVPTDDHLFYELSESDTEPRSLSPEERGFIMGLLGMLLAIGLGSALYYFVVHKRYRALSVDNNVSDLLDL